MAWLIDKHGTHWELRSVGNEVLSSSLLPTPWATLPVCSRTRVIDPNLSPCFQSCPHLSSSLSLNTVTNLVTPLIKSPQRLLNFPYGMAFKPLLIQEGGSPVFAASVYVSHSFSKPSSTPTPDSSPHTLLQPHWPQPSTDRSPHLLTLLLPFSPLDIPDCWVTSFVKTCLHPFTLPWNLEAT